MNASLIRLFTFALLATFPLGVLLRYKVATNIYVVPQDIFAIAIFLLIIIDHFALKKRNIDSIFIFQVIFVLVGLSSLAINSLLHNDIRVIPAVSYALRYLVYSSLINVSAYFNNSKTIKFFVFGSGICFVVFSFVQYYFFNSLRPLMFLGWDEHLYRIFSTFLDPNFAAVFLVFFSFLLIPKVFKGRLTESYRSVLLFYFTQLALFMTYSRTGLVALISGFFSYSIITRKLKLFFVVTLLIVVSLFIFSDTKVEGLNPFRTVSSSERITSMLHALEIVKENPIIGVGFNAYRDVQIREGVRNLAGANISNADAGTDNSILFVLATTGILGFTFFTASYAILLRRLHKENTQISRVLLSATVGLLFGSLFLNVLFYTPILSFVLIVISVRKNLL